MSRLKTKYSGFTIIELIVIISVIGILASITIVGYGAWGQRAAQNSVKSDLANVASSMESARNFSNQYPTTIPSTFTPSTSIVLQTTATTADSFCINAYHLKYPSVVFSYSSKSKSVQPNFCPGLLTGSPVGGTPPNTPLGVNLVSDLSTWTLTGGITYNSAAGELVFTAAGSATSPPVKIDRPTSAKLTVESYATTAAPQATCTPNSCVYFSSMYYGSDGTTSALNSAGYASNGNAQMTPLSSWQTRSWTTPAGPNVVYIKFVINSDPATYTSNNRIRNVSIMAL